MPKFAPGETVWTNDPLSLNGTVETVFLERLAEARPIKEKAK